MTGNQQRDASSRPISLFASPLFFILGSLCFISSQVTFVNAKVEGFDPNNKEPKYCKPFRCPAKDSEPIPKWPLKITSSGCDSMGGGGVSMFNPGGASGDNDIAHCCDEYNACLGLCGSNQHLCDSIFKTCSETACAALSTNDRRDGCNKNLDTKNIIMSLGNCRDFEEGQRTGCECVKTSKAGKIRGEIIKKFYKKFNPDGMGKVDALIEKVTDSKKFTALMLKLIKKYPKSIRKVVNQQNRRMEDLMKDYKTQDMPPSPKEEKLGKAEETYEDSNDDVESDENIEL